MSEVVALQVAVGTVNFAAHGLFGFENFGPPAKFTQPASMPQSISTGSFMCCVVEPET
jgi:hypothetical protein